MKRGLFCRCFYGCRADLVILAPRDLTAFMPASTAELMIASSIVLWDITAPTRKPNTYVPLDSSAPTSRAPHSLSATIAAKEPPKWNVTVSDTFF